MPLLHEILFRTYVASNARNYDLGERFREICTFLSNGNVRKRVRNYRKLHGKPISRKCHNVWYHYQDEDHFSKYLQEKIAENNFIYLIIRVNSIYLLTCNTI